MPITKKDFHDIENKTITLMGMSGVGKTYLSLMLAEQGWYHYSCDLEIGTTLLGDEIEKTLGEPNRVTADDLSQLSNYVSRLGDLPYDEFKRRQQQYYQAECNALHQLPEIVAGANAEGFQNVLNDSTGSLCEIDDDVLLDTVDENSLIVYIKANAEEEKAVLQRAQDYPKPMFFSPERFDFWVEEYSAEHDGIDKNDFNADDFGRWVFPRLFENRLPKYQRLADKYGTTIPSDEFHKIKTSDDFLNLIVRYLPDHYS